MLHYSYDKVSGSAYFIGDIMSCYIAGTIPCGHPAIDHCLPAPIENSPCVEGRRYRYAPLNSHPWQVRTKILVANCNISMSKPWPIIAGGTDGLFRLHALCRSGTSSTVGCGCSSLCRVQPVWPDACGSQDWCPSWWWCSEDKHHQSSCCTSKLHALLLRFGILPHYC